MNQLDYFYVEVNRIVERNTYFYTPAVGEPMVQSWRASRDAILAELPEPSGRPAAQTATNLAELSTTGSVVTAELLKQLMVAVQGDAQTSNADFWLDRLVHKYETTKRLHRNYDEKFRAVDRTKIEDLDLYVSFAEILDTSFRADGKLPKLNALMKLIDTLCSVRDLLSTDMQQRLAALIQSEKELVSSIGLLAD